jgi:hypothetical protein
MPRPIRNSDRLTFLLREPGLGKPTTLIRVDADDIDKGIKKFVLRVRELFR